MGQPQGGQVRRLGNNVERGLGVSFGKSNHRKEKVGAHSRRYFHLETHLLPESYEKWGLKLRLTDHDCSTQRYSTVVLWF